VLWASGCVRLILYRPFFVLPLKFFRCDHTEKASAMVCKMVELLKNDPLSPLGGGDALDSHSLFFAIEYWYVVGMSRIRKILVVALSFSLLDFREWLGNVGQDMAERFLRQEYPQDDHTHSEDSQPTLDVQMAKQEIPPPTIPFVPDDDSQMYGAFLSPQHGHKSPYLSDLIAAANS
jgi:hypothetical protein